MSFIGSEKLNNRLQETISRISGLTDHKIYRIPATDSDLILLGNFFGFDELPAELVQLYRWQDGGSVDWLEQNSFWSMMPIKFLIDMTDYWHRHSVSIELPQALGCADKEFFYTLPPRVVPVFQWNAAIFGLIDFRSKADGPVIGFDLEADRVVTWASSLTNFMELIAENFEFKRELNIDELQKLTGLK